MSRAWIIRWTILVTVFLSLPVAGLALTGRGASLTVFMIGFAGLLVAGMVIADKLTPWQRYIPLLVAPVIVGLWPLQRLILAGDTRTGEVFLSFVAILGGIIGLAAAFQYVRQRGWVVETPVRRRLYLALVVLLAIHEFSDVEWLGAGWGAIAMLVLMFWPSRASLRRAAVPPSSPPRSA